MLPLINQGETLLAAKTGRGEWVLTSRATPEEADAVYAQLQPFLTAQGVQDNKHRLGRVKSVCTQLVEAIRHAIDARNAASTAAFAAAARSARALAAGAPASIEHDDDGAAGAAAGDAGGAGDGRARGSMARERRAGAGRGNARSTGAPATASNRRRKAVRAPLYEDGQDEIEAADEEAAAMEQESLPDSGVLRKRKATVRLDL